MGQAPPPQHTDGVVEALGAEGCSQPLCGKALGVPRTGSRQGRGSHGLCFP